MGCVMKKIIVLLSFSILAISANVNARAGDQSCVSWGHTIQPGEKVCYRKSKLQYRCPKYQNDNNRGLLKRVQKLTGGGVFTKYNCDYVDNNNSSPGTQY